MRGSARWRKKPRGWKTGAGLVAFGCRSASAGHGGAPVQGGSGVGHGLRISRIAGDYGWLYADNDGLDVSVGAAIRALCAAWSL